MTTSTNETLKGIEMSRYQVQEKIAYSFVGKLIAKLVKAVSSKHADSRLHWIQQEIAEFGIK